MAHFGSRAQMGISCFSMSARCFFRHAGALALNIFMEFYGFGHPEGGKAVGPPLEVVSKVLRASTLEVGGEGLPGAEYVPL